MELKEALKKMAELANEGKKAELYPDPDDEDCGWMLLVEDSSGNHAWLKAGVNPQL